MRHSVASILRLIAAQAVFCAIFAAFCMGEAQAVAPVHSGFVSKTDYRTEKRVMDWNGQKREYLVHVPPTYDGVKKLPMVVCLHGGGGHLGYAVKMTRFNEKADKENFIVVYPNGSGRLEEKFLTWNSGKCCGWAKYKQVDDVAFMKAFLERLQKEVSYDQKRVYLVGFSNGAMMANKLATELPTSFAAVAIISGALHGDEKKPAVPVPVLIVHGTADKHVPVEGGNGKLAKWGFPVHAMPLDYSVKFWVDVDGCSPEPEVSVLSDGQVRCERYRDGEEGSEVVLYTIEGSGHSWPGGVKAWLLADPPSPALVCTDVCWDFFSQHHRN